MRRKICQKYIGKIKISIFPYVHLEFDAFDITRIEYIRSRLNKTDKSFMRIYGPSQYSAEKACIVLRTESR